MAEVRKSAKLTAACALAREMAAEFRGLQDTLKQQRPHRGSMTGLPKRLLVRAACSSERIPIANACTA